MFIHLNSMDNPMPAICDALGEEEILRQAYDSALVYLAALQGAYKAVRGTQEEKDKAKEALTVACGDDLKYRDALVELGWLDRDGVQFVGRYKREEWRKSVLGGKGDGG